MPISIELITGQGAETKRSWSIHPMGQLYSIRQGLGKDRKSQRWCLTTQKHCLLDTAGNVNIWTHHGYGIIHNTCVSPSQTRFQHEDERWSWSPSSVELFVTDTASVRGRVNFRSIQQNIHGSPMDVNEVYITVQYQINASIMLC